MELKEGVRLALQSLWANKMRSILTLIGVVIGVASVIMVVTLTNGAKDFVTTKINTYGAGVVTISKMPQTFITIDEYLSFQKRRDVTIDDYKAILSECKSCRSVGARRNTTGPVVYGNHSSTDTDVRGWTWTMPALSNLNIAPRPLIHSRSKTFQQRARRHRRLRRRRQSSRPRRSPWQRDPRQRHSLYCRHRCRRGAGQDARPEHGTTGSPSPSARSFSPYGAHATMDIYVDAGGGGAVMEVIEDQLRSISARPPPSRAQSGRHVHH